MYWVKQKLIISLLAAGLLLLWLRPFTQQEPVIGVDSTLTYFREHAVEFAVTAVELEKRIQLIDENDTTTIDAAKKALVNCRIDFKKIEFFFNYFFPSLTIIYNAPAVIEVEEPFLEYREPTGLQVIAALLYAKDAAKLKKQLLQQAYIVSESAKDIPSLLYNLDIDDARILESIRLELISVMTLGIAGFDTPELKTGITEARQTLTTIKEVLQPYFVRLAGPDSLQFYLDQAIRLSAAPVSFNDFDRLGFLTNAAIPLQRHLGLFINRSGLLINTNPAINYQAESIFSRDALNINGSLSVDTQQALLGKKLFFDKILSGNSDRNCASCHQPAKYFSDGLPKSLALDGHSFVQRNAPSLLYTGYQYSQFWDGRAKTLEEQVIDVLKNPREMNANDDSIVSRLNRDTAYLRSFSSAFSTGKAGRAVSIANVASAIAAYMKMLTPFDSPFDHYLKGEKKELSASQIRGFNLFMGKAACATCHSLPLFNGLVPPLYDLTAMEVIGTTADTVFSAPRLDADSGRFTHYPIEFYLRSFKTPGLRNVSATAPYMHNGTFPDLESVLEFYNKGGGEGLGLKVEHQTLSPEPLQLTKAEIKNIIDFLQALTDRRIYQSM